MSERRVQWILQAQGDAEVSAALSKVRGEMSALKGASETARKAQTELPNSFTQIQRASNTAAVGVRSFTDRVKGLAQGLTPVSPLFGNASTAATGFGAAFGPIGLAIGAVAGVALPALIRSLGDTEDAAKDAAEQMLTLAEAISRVEQRQREMEQQQRVRGGAGSLLEQQGQVEFLEARLRALRASQESIRNRFTQASDIANRTRALRALSETIARTERELAQARNQVRSAEIRGGAPGETAAQQSERIDASLGRSDEERRRARAEAEREEELRRRQGAAAGRAREQRELQEREAQQRAFLSLKQEELELAQKLADSQRAQNDEIARRNEMMVASFDKDAEHARAVAEALRDRREREAEVNQLNRERMDALRAEAQGVAAELGFVANIWNGVIGDVTAGEKTLLQSLQERGAVELQNIGQALVGKGVMHIAEGAVLSLMAVPTGPAIVGIGVGEVAAGTALGATGIGIAGAGGASGGAQVPSAPAPAGGGGGSVVNVTQQIHDPVDQARMGRIAEEGARATRRQFSGRV